MKRSIFIVALMIPALLAAGDAPQPAPRSPAAVAAIAKHDHAAADALTAYRSAVLAANHAEIEELKKAQADVLKGGGPGALTEGNAIQGVIDKATKEWRAENSGNTAKDLAGTSWLHTASGGIIKLEPSGIASCAIWHAPGKWHNTDFGALIEEPGGLKINLVPDAESNFALYIYAGQNKATIAKKQ